MVQRNQNENNNGNEYLRLAIDQSIDHYNQIFFRLLLSNVVNRQSLLLFICCLLNTKYTFGSSVISFFFIFM